MTKLLNNRKRSELGAFVMSKRKALELSLTELAELTGISRSYLGQI